MGWLLFSHGVLTSYNVFGYSFGSALLDMEQTWKVIYRGGPSLLSPPRDYECVGDVPNVVFPCAALLDPPTGRIAICYGGAETVPALASAQQDEVLEFLKTSSET